MYVHGSAVGPGEENGVMSQPWLPWIALLVSPRLRQDQAAYHDG